MDNTFQRYFNFYSNTWYQVFNDPIALQENSHEKQATYTKSSSHNSFTNNF
jgi:lipocalin